MPGYNRVILVGNLTRDPELRYTPQGTAVSDLSLAINTMRGKGNDRKEDTVFIDVTVWDRQAETCNEYLSKGSPILVEGRLRQEKWEDKETGQKRSKISITAQTVQFLGTGGGGGDSGGGKGRQSSAPARNQNSGQGSGQGSGQNSSLDEDFPEGGDVPF